MKLKVLVVDDSRLMRRLVMGAVGRVPLADFTFVEASGGAEALALLAADRFDLVLSDWHMPQMSGAEFIGELRRLPGAADLPVVVTSSDAAAAPDAVAPGLATAFLRKPFTEQHAEAVLREVIARPCAGSARAESR